MHRPTALKALAAGLAAGLFAVFLPGAAAAETAPPVQRSLILNAFGDAEATYGESLPFLAALSAKVDRTRESAYCKAVVEGTLYGQPVAVVVTGTGGGNAGPCTQEMLGWYSPHIKEIIWSGIGGVTPAVGGMYDRAGRVLGNPEVMIGDVCVGTASWSWDLHFSNVNDWAARRNPPTDVYAPSGGWWEMVDSQGKQVVPGFDNVQQFVVADPALADEILRAAKSTSVPKRPASVTEKIARFHPEEASWRPPKFYSYRECGGEISGDDFWHGATEDRLAREYMSALMRSSGINRTARPNTIVAFSAMEAVPWMSAVSRWNAKFGTRIPMVVVRSGSNYDQIPLRPDGQPVLNKRGRPLTAMQDILLGFDDTSSAYASSIAAAPILRMFELRSGQQ
jgi:purine nucleoside permease